MIAWWLVSIFLLFFFENYNASKLMIMILFIFCILKVLLKKFNFFYFFLQINMFLVFLDYFDVLILKMFFKK